MRRTLLWALGLLVAIAPLAAAQIRDTPAGRREMLRRQIEERFSARIRQDLGLNDDEARRLRTTMDAYRVKRIELERTERILKAAIGAQLRPGVAANQDSLAKLTDGLADLKVAQVQTYRDELRELSAFLSPVQRAQLFIMRERLMERVQEIVDERSDGPRQRPR